MARDIESKSVGRSRLAQGLAGAGAAVAGWRIGPEAAVVAAGVQPFVEDFLARARAEWSTKGQILGRGAEAEAQRIRPRITEDEIWEALVGDYERRAFMIRVLEAAKRTGREDKLWALGAILGRVAAQGDQLDQASVIAVVLDDLEGAHAAVLRVLASHPTADSDNAPSEYWDIEQLIDRLPLDRGIVLACTGSLGRHGLTEEASDRYGGIMHLYRLTDFGRSVFDLISLLPSPTPGQDGTSSA